MFADPQSITVNGVAKTLPRVSIGNNEATYRSADDVWQMRIAHTTSKGRKRRMVEIRETIIAADPLTAENTSQYARTYIVIDEPAFGFSDTTLKYDLNALRDWAGAGTNADKLLGGES